MRLTLRTLMAWIDRVLPADDQRALGDKVAASPVAGQLVDRIQTAVGRAELPAPAVIGKGLADGANTVAEFLDNVLPGDRLEAFERICIDSDMHLAEAAACHRMLAEMSRDPAATESAPDLHRRLMKCVVEHATPPIRVREREESVAVVRDLRAAVTAASRSAAAKRRPIGAWVSALVAVGLLAMLGGILILTLARPKRTEVAAAQPARPGTQAPPVSAPSAERPAAPAPAGAATVGVVKPAPPVASPPPATPSQTPPATPPQAPPAAAAIPTAPPAEPPGEPVQPDAAQPDAAATASAIPDAAPQTAANPPPAAPAERLVPQGNALAIVAPPEAPAEPEGQAQPAIAAPPAGAVGNPAPARPAGDPAAARAARFERGELLLRRAVGQGEPQWTAVASGAPLEDQEDLVAPPWCRPQISCGAAMIRLEPNTRAVLGRDADGVPRLEVVFGRAVAWSEAAELRLGISVAGLVGRVAAPARQPLGIELSLEREPGSEPADAPVRRRAVITATDGGASWRQTEADGSAAAKPLGGIPAQSPLPPRASLSWDEADPGTVSLGPPGPEPTWLRGPRFDDRIEQSAVRELAGKLAAAVPVRKPLEDVAAGDHRAENRLAAAATLALLGEYEPTVALLCAETSSPEGLSEAQWTTLERLTVPLALARGVNAAAKLRQAFEKLGPAASVPPLFVMARGLSADEFAAGGDAQLVEALSAKALVVRRYAIRNLQAILPPADRDRIAYRADRKPDLNREAITWWQNRLKQGGLERSDPAEDAAAP